MQIDLPYNKFKHMEIAEEIKNIRKDLDTLVQIFSKLVNKIVPEEA